MSTLHGIDTLLLITYVMSIALIDMRTHRIPNVISAAALGAALTIQVTMQGVAGVADAVLGMSAGLLVFLPFYIVRAFGAGDVKAMAVVGAFVGFPQAFVAAAATLIGGAIIGLAIMIKDTPSVRIVMFRLLGVASAPMAAARSDASSADQTQRFPYGVAIAIGALVVVIRSGTLA